jgi:hypothetical protein
MQAIPLFDLQDHCASVREAVVARLDATLDSQRFILGPEVTELEQAFAALVGATQAIGCASGTDALILSLHACAEVLSLPIYPKLGEERVRIVAAVVRDFYRVGETRPPLPCT